MMAAAAAALQAELNGLETAVSINVAGGIPPHEAAVDAATAEWVASSPTAWPVPGQHARAGSFAFSQHPPPLSRSAPS